MWCDLFTSWFIFVLVTCHWPNALVSEAHIINHEGHYSSIITLSQSEPTTFPMCALSSSIHNANTHIDMWKVCSTQQQMSQKSLYYWNNVWVCINGVWDTIALNTIQTYPLYPQLWIHFSSHFNLNRDFLQNATWQSLQT